MSSPSATIAESGNCAALHIAGDTIAGLASAQGSAIVLGDRRVELRGDRLLPGLINAHDHLQLNSFPRATRDVCYHNAADWIRDVGTRREHDLRFAAAAQRPREARLLAGALKNLLSGVTTVAHHDPLYPELLRAGFPVRVVERYGWSHSLHIDGEAAVQRACRETSIRRPWIIHAGEGIDAEARSEFARLDALGCIRPRTLLVHGIAFVAPQRRRLIAAGAGVIWCPASNLHLFGHTAYIEELLACHRLGIGTDSRLSGARDLLEELRIARDLTGLEEDTALRLATRDNAALLGLSDRGVLRAGARADLLVLPQHLPLTKATRADVRIVMIGGRMLYGDAEYAYAFAPASNWAHVRIDRRAKVLDGAISEALRAHAVHEPGFEWPAEEIAA